jgi:hypothetical protein
MIGMMDASMNIVNDEMDDGRWREEYFVFALRVNANKRPHFGPYFTMGLFS